ncbi:hypothetical protein GIB67_011549 [Kingdonia uniflora]|uniref:CASP-like protein n=1 Tax=Kingdonia uniflora TaxID=39325 RepID=A0A7J7NME9_9MAGN|nr:hypothetical protein GIB67_011549 [Kingdonia uniflora]
MTKLFCRYMVCINAISTGYSLVSISTSWLKCFLTKAWIFFVSDQVPLKLNTDTSRSHEVSEVSVFNVFKQVIAYLMVTSGAAVVDILYLAYNGDREISWSEACSSYGRFCSRVKVALVLHGFACFCYFGLSMMSACRVFRQFEPPAPSKVVEDETNYH